MAKVTWINGTIDPPQSGEYYVTLEAKQDMVDPETGEVWYRAGDVMIDTDCYYACAHFWEQLGKDNPFWELLCWADILKPNIPDGVRDRLVEYFGEKCSGKTDTRAQTQFHMEGGQEQ